MINLARVKAPYVKWRQQADGSIRPRFSPGPAQRAQGWNAEDLRHEDGRWFNVEEALVWATKRHAAMRAGGAPEAPVGVAVQSVETLIAAWQRSPDFKRLGSKTQSDYISKSKAVLLRKIDRTTLVRRALADMPARSVRPADVKALWETIRVERGKHMARQVKLTLSAAYAWASMEKGWEIETNPCHLPHRLPLPPARLVVWGRTEARAMLAYLDAKGWHSMGDAFVLALYTGQRMADVLQLRGRGFAAAIAAGEPIRLRQNKTGERVAIFPIPELVARLTAAEARRTAIEARLAVVEAEPVVCMREDTGAAWHEGQFSVRFGRLLREAGEACPALLAAKNTAAGADADAGPLCFQDLRDTAITMLGMADCTLPQIASISGHSLQSITAILKHYLQLNEGMARVAGEKLATFVAATGWSVS